MYHPGFKKYKGQDSKAEGYKDKHEKSQLNVCFRDPSANALVSSDLEIWLPTPTRLQTAAAHLDRVFKEWVSTSDQQPQNRVITEPLESDFIICYSFIGTSVPVKTL